MKVKMLTTIGGYKKGEVYDVPEERGGYWVQMKRADQHKEAPNKKPKPNKRRKINTEKK